MLQWREVYTFRHKALQPFRGLLKHLAGSEFRVEFSNDCEVIARKRFREVDAVLSWLLEYAPSRLTGTGACVFAEFDTESEARQVLEQAPEWLNGFVAKGVNLSPLHRAML